MKISSRPTINKLTVCPRIGCGGQVLFDIDWHCLQCGVRNVMHEDYSVWKHRVITINGNR